MKVLVKVADIRAAMATIIDRLKGGAEVREANEDVFIPSHHVGEAGITDIAPSEIIKLVNEEKTVHIYLRGWEGSDLLLGKHNGTRFYWKKDVLDEFEIEVPDFDDDKVVICPDKERYTPYERGERISMDCADFVAIFLRGLGEDVFEVVKRVTVLLDKFDVPVPKKSNGTSWVDHAAYHWEKLNNGQQRMLAGQALRHACKTNEDLVGYIKGLPQPKPTKKEKKPSRELPKKVKRNTKKK